MKRLSAALTVLTIAVALSCAAPAYASGGTSYTWVGSSQDASADNHSWGDLKNWSPNGVPGDGDSVMIAEPDATHCTAHVDGVPTAALANFALKSTRCSSSVNGGALTVSGTFSWDGGTLNTPTRIDGDGLLSGTNSHLSALTAELDIAGSLTLSGIADSGASNMGGFRITNPNVLQVLPGGTLSSLGANAVQFLSCCNAPAKIVNHGTIAVSGGDLAVHAVELDQDGVLTASSGGRLVSDSAPLKAGSGASYTGNGSWLIEDGAKAAFSGSQSIGPGFHVELGGLGVNAGVQLGGTATLTGGGVLDWTGGTIEGNLTIAHGTSVHASGAHTDNGKRFLSGVDPLSGNASATLTNHGTIVFDHGAGVLTGNQARLVNESDGTVSLAPGTHVSTLSCCISPSKLINSGTVTVPTGTSTDAALLDGVAYQATGGTTSIAGGRTFEVDLAPSALTTTSVAGGGVLELAAPTAVSGTIHVSAPSKLALRTGGSLDGIATISGSGALSWTGGSMSGRLRITATGGTRVSGADLKSVANVGGGGTPSSITLGSRTSIASGSSTKHDRVDLGQSTLTLASSTSVGHDVEINYGTLVNTGSLMVNPGSTGVALRGGSGPFTNQGTLKVGSGRLRINGSYTQRSGTTNIASHAHLDLLYVSRTIALAGGVLEGAGSIGAGVDNTHGTVKPGGTSTATLHVSGAYTQGSHGGLALDLASKTRDLLAVSGAVALRGKLAVHDLGGYHPKRGAKYLVVSSASLGHAISCATTSGGGSTNGHWSPGHTTAGLYVTWQAGSRTHC